MYAIYFEFSQTQAWLHTYTHIRHLLRQGPADSLDTVDGEASIERIVEVTAPIRCMCARVHVWVRVHTRRAYVRVRVHEVRMCVLVCTRACLRVCARACVHL